jgi:hypothetical protein
MVNVTEVAPELFRLSAEATFERMRPKRQLSKDTLDLMCTPQVRIKSKHQFPTLAPETTDENNAIGLSYGLGWGLYFTRYGEALFKEGHDDGWRNYCIYFREPKMGVVTDSSNGENIYDELLQTLQKNKFTPLEWEGFPRRNIGKVQP